MTQYSFRRLEDVIDVDLTKDESKILDAAIKAFGAYKKETTGDDNSYHLPDKLFSLENMARKFYRAITQMIELELLEETTSEDGKARYRFNLNWKGKFFMPEALENMRKGYASVRMELYEEIAKAYAGHSGFTKKEIVKHFTEGIKELAEKGVMDEAYNGKHTGQYISAKLANPLSRIIFLGSGFYASDHKSASGNGNSRYSPKQSQPVSAVSTV